MCELLASGAPSPPRVASFIHALPHHADLERLDFESNPATTIKAYRHQLVCRLPRVTELDGEEVTALEYAPPSPPSLPSPPTLPGAPS